MTPDMPTPPDAADPFPQIEAPPRPRPPRIWTPLVALLLVVPATIVVQLVVLFGGMLITGRGLSGREGITAFVATPGGFLLMLVSSQIVFLAAAVVPAILSPTPFRQRLGLVRSTVHPVVWPVLAIGSLFLIVLGGILRVLLFGMEPSEHLEEFSRVFTDAPGLWGPGLALAASVLPGICEEAFFRGYFQRRLLLRWTPALAIGLTSLAFAAVHMDPQHVVAVTPLAFWLGYVGWRTASLWPCILCHFVVNGTSLTLALAGMDEERLAGPGPALIVLLVIGLAFVACIASVVLLEFAAARRRRTWSTWDPRFQS